MTATFDQPLIARRSATPRVAARAALVIGRSSGIVVEQLEARRLFAAGATLDADGILTIEGTQYNDHIRIYRSRNDAPNDLIVDGRGGYGSGTPYFGGVFDLSAVRGIRIYGLAGDDLMYVWNDPDADDHNVIDDYGKLDIPVTMYGGAGNDDMESQSNADDVYVGGPGRDNAYTHDGTDLYGVERVENYRDADWANPDRTRLPYGAFAWTGTPDELYPDPWHVPNLNGYYNGIRDPEGTMTWEEYQAWKTPPPVVPEPEPTPPTQPQPEPEPAPRPDETAVAPEPQPVVEPERPPEAGSDAVVMTAPPKAVSPFSTGAAVEADDDENVWDA
jgi:hypothetical protein